MKALYNNYFRKNSKNDPVLKALESVPIFDGLSHKESYLRWPALRMKGPIKDEHIFKQHAPAEGMYVILDGAVEIKDPESGTIFASLETGDFFGELALLDEEPRSASAHAIQPSRLIGFLEPTF